MRTPLVAFAAVAVAAGPARADGALDELSAGNTPQTASTPQQSWVSDTLAGYWDATERWQLRADFTATRDYTKTPSSTGLGDPGDILLANLSVEFDPDESWSLRAVGGYSPSSTLQTSSSLPLRTMTGSTETATAALNSTSSSLTGAAWAGYDSTSIEFPTAVTAVATANDFHMQQQITSVDLPGGQMMTDAQLQTYCMTNKCSRELRGALDGQMSQLAQYILEGNFSQTLWKTTDVGVDAAYFLYSQDPTKVGYFSAGALGRSSSFGGGMGIAPYKWNVVPDVIHRFGGVMVMASLSYGQYVDSEGNDMTATLRVQWKIKLDRTKRVKLWGKVTGSQDVDSTNAVAYSASAALGAQYTW